MKKAIFSILLFAAMIQLMSCSNATEQTASHPQEDSTHLVSPAPGQTAGGGDELVPPNEVSPAEVKKALIAGGKWLQFGIIPVHKSDSANLANYTMQYNEKMGVINCKPIEETLIFSAPDKYEHACQFEPIMNNMESKKMATWEKGKDGKTYRSGTFEISEQNILLLNAGKKENLNDEKLKMVSLSAERFITVDTFSVAQIKFPVYKVYVKTE